MNVEIGKMSEVSWESRPDMEGLSFGYLMLPEQNPDLTIRAAIVPPGKVLSVHAHDTSSETFYILQGKGVLTCETDEEIPTEAGEVIYAPAGVQHGLRNTGDEDLHLLAIFSPPLP